MDVYGNIYIPVYIYYRFTHIYIYTYICACIFNDVLWTRGLLWSSQIRHLVRRLQILPDLHLHMPTDQSQAGADKDAWRPLEGVVTVHRVTGLRPP